VAHNFLRRFYIYDLSLSINVLLFSVLTPCQGSSIDDFSHGDSYWEWLDIQNY